MKKIFALTFALFFLILLAECYAIKRKEMGNVWLKLNKVERVMYIKGYKEGHMQGILLPVKEYFPNNKEKIMKELNNKYHIFKSKHTKKEYLM